LQCQTVNLVLIFVVSIVTTVVILTPLVVV